MRRGDQPSIRGELHDAIARRLSGSKSDRNLLGSSYPEGS